MAPINRQTQNRQRVLTERRRSSEINRAINRLSNNLVRLNIPRNRYNLGTITKANNRYMSVRLSRKLIDNLKEVYTRTWTRQVEYAGTIPFTINNTRNIMLSKEDCMSIKLNRVFVIFYKKLDLKRPTFSLNQYN